MSEARTGKRFPLELPIKIHRQGGDDDATTADMSAAGVYIMADTDLPVGTPTDVEVRCTGRVVRKETGAAGGKKKHKKSGVACVIDEYKFIRKNKGSR